MKKLPLTILLLLVVNYLQAQTARDSVIATINMFFEGMKKADTMLLKRSLSETAVLQTISDKGGNTSVRNENLSNVIKSIGQLAPGAADEKIEIGTVLIDAGLASVWTPYKFYFKGQLSHCGVNSFQLVRLNGAWKIQYIIDTRRKECN